MYNKKLNILHYKKKAIKKNEDFLIVNDAPPSNDEWIINENKENEFEQTFDIEVRRVVE